MDFVLKVILNDYENNLPVDKFQSLFYWILFLRSKTFRRRNGKKEVSILVLLDFVLKDEHR